MLQTDRPAGLIVMSRSVLPSVLPGDLRTRLSQIWRPLEPQVAESFEEAGAALAQAEILLTGWGCPPLTAEVLDAAPRLKAVVHAAGSVKLHVGLDVFARGIGVSSAADANADPVVDFTIAALTLAGKRAFTLARAYALGSHADFPGRPGNDGRVVGVVGASRIGRRVAGKLARLGFRVLIADPYLDAAGALALGAELADLDSLCARSDVVTIHAPALPETYHLFDERRLALLPDGAVLINTARGSLIDTDALVRACAAGRVDAVLDVTDPEPLPAGHPLFALRNVWITPHLAGVQGSETRRLGEYAVAEVERFVAGQPLHGALSAEQLPVLA